MRDMSNSLRIFMVVLVIVFVGVLGTVLFVGNRAPVDVLTSSTTVNPADFINNESSYVSWTQEGKLVGDNERKAVRITVSPKERKAELLEGYNQKVVKTVKLTNNQKAYASFMLALEKLGYSDEKKSAAVDERGECPFGKRYIYEVFEEETSKMRLWSDSCATDHGTFDGNARGVRNLFKAQITDFNKFVLGIKF
jgi:hypothetical protein